jgi:stage V sporulation protein D (sporulation-specific penicillin-binding protein)
MKTKKRRKIKRFDEPHKQRARRFLLTGLFFGICICGLIFRMWWLHDTYGDEYTVRVAEQIARRDIAAAHEIFAPMRGGFLDRNMQPITGTQQVFTVALDIEALHQRYVNVRRRSPEIDIREPLFAAIIEELGVSRWELLEKFELDEYGNLKIKSGRNWFVLKNDVPAEIAIPLTQIPVPGTNNRVYSELHIRETSLRWYPDPFFAPQVIGFTRGDSAWGLESQYRTELEGEQGRSIWAMGETETVPVRDGYTLITTLDGEIQRLAQEHVNKAIEKHPSRFVGMVVMSPFTGEILAMAQAPTFSLEEPFNHEFFSDARLKARWNDLDESQRTTEVMSLWRNYHTTRSNEPGSTFKPFVIAAAVEEGIINQHNTFFCAGRREFSDQIVWCHNRDFGCGNLTLRSAIARSCNMAMVDINRMLERDLFYKYRGYFGFGERTGIDLPGEEDVSSPYVMYPYSMLNTVEMATSSIGQGFNATTMQLLNGYAALINGGNLMQPYLISQIVNAQGYPVHENAPTIVRRVISEETSDFIRNELRYVVSARPGVFNFTGTGWRSYIAGYDIGGKTGTAQQGVRGGGEYIPTYVTYLPVENPQYLVLMTIDRIEDVDYRYAGGTIAPLMREFLLDLIRVKNIQPSGAEDITPEIFGTPMPDFAGQRLSDAVRRAINMGTNAYQVVGGGTVVSHTWPASGQTMPETSPITFFTDPESRIGERMISVPDVVGLKDTVAHFLLTEAGLPTVIVTETQNNSGEDSTPITGGAEPIGDNILPAPASHTVHTQFPAAGSEVEQGTQVIIRAR